MARQVYSSPRNKEVSKRPGQCSEKRYGARTRELRVTEGQRSEEAAWEVRPRPEQTGHGNSREQSKANLLEAAAASKARGGSACSRERVPGQGGSWEVAQEGV